MKPYFTDHFKRQLKRLLKKFPHLKEDLLGHLKDLDLNKEIHIGRSVYKIRIKSSDLNKGKSGGFRSYILAWRIKALLIPLCIYPKNEKESLTENELRYHLDQASDEIEKI